mmetsp:Transcript_60686/g.198652  ORF Transcript_60686/g.198652 Transcript_60686/m.198652 type:complete len:230 (-) Transcript_60686:2927-3616(-)
MVPTPSCHKPAMARTRELLPMPLSPAINKLSPRPRSMENCSMRALGWNPLRAGVSKATSRISSTVPEDSERLRMPMPGPALGGSQLGLRRRPSMSRRATASSQSRRMPSWPSAPPATVWQNPATLLVLWWISPSAAIFSPKERLLCKTRGPNMLRPMACTPRLNKKSLMSSPIALAMRNFSKGTKERFKDSFAAHSSKDPPPRSATASAFSRMCSRCACSATLWRTQSS